MVTSGDMMLARDAVKRAWDAMTALTIECSPVDLGALGNVDHFANDPRCLSVGIVGSKYRLEWRTVVSGALRTEPYDARMFDSVYVARQALRDEKAMLAARGAA